MDKYIEIESFLSIARDWNAAIVVTNNECPPEIIHDFEKIRKYIKLGVDKITYKDELFQEMHICIAGNRQITLEVL